MRKRYLRIEMKNLDSKFEYNDSESDYDDELEEENINKKNSNTLITSIFSVLSFELAISIFWIIVIGVKDIKKVIFFTCILLSLTYIFSFLWDRIKSLNRSNSKYIIDKIEIKICFLGIGSIFASLTATKLSQIDYFKEFYNYKYITLCVLTISYIFILIEGKGWFVKNILFSYKSLLMDRYYNCLNKKEHIDGYEWEEDNSSVEEVIIPCTNNGRLIGLIEGFLVAIGVMIQSAVFIGIVLAVRSYVAVSSHPNKEESEFYIIGTLGSLLFTILLTFIYILVVESFTNINIFTVISSYLNSVKIIN